MKLPDQTTMMPGNGATDHFLNGLVREALESTKAPMEVQVVDVLALEESEATEIFTTHRANREHKIARAVNAPDSTQNYLPERMAVRHHAIARLMAMGWQQARISEHLGISQSRLSILKQSPAFQALILEYMNMLDKGSVETYTRLKIAGNLGIDELTSRIVEKPQTIKNSELIEIVKMSADRTGLGPTSKQVTLNGRISPADIRAIKATSSMAGSNPAERDPLGGIGGPARVLEIEGALDPVAEGGGEVREDDGAVSQEENGRAGLVTDLGEIFR